MADATDTQGGPPAGGPTAGPSTGAPTAGPSHPAFPTAASYGGKVSHLPESEGELWALITAATTERDIKNRLVPVLQGLTSELKNGKGAGEVLSIPSFDVGAATDEQLAAHSIALVFILNARLTRPPKNTAVLKTFATRLALGADPAQLLMAPPQVTEFAWGLLRLAKKDKEVAQVIEPLRSLLDKTSQPGGYFRGVHAVYLEACLSAGDTSSALSTIESYANVHEGTPYRDVLAYYHHAGTIAAMHEEYALASALFTFGAAAPASVASAIQLACARRAILSELLHTGREIQWPKDLSPAMDRVMEKSLERYTRLAIVFSSGDWAGVRSQAEAGKTTFERDCNWGLVERLLLSITKRRILKLRQTYSRMPLATLASKVDAPEAEVRSWIDAMSSRGEIRASISPSPEIVTFEDEADYASADNIARLREEQQRTTRVNLDLEAANRAMALNRKWLIKQVQALESREKGKDAIKTRGGDMEDDDIGAPPVRGAGGNLADMGF